MWNRGRVLKGFEKGKKFNLNYLAHIFQFSGLTFLEYFDCSQKHTLEQTEAWMIFLHVC